MHNQLKNHFRTEFPKKEIFDGTYIAKKGNFFMVHIRDPKINLEFVSKNETPMGPTFPRPDDTTKQAMSTVCQPIF